MVLEQRSSSLNPTLHNTEQRLPNKTPLCNLQSGLLLRKHRPNTFERSQVSATPLNIAGAVNFRGEAALASLSRALLSSSSSERDFAE